MRYAQGKILDVGCGGGRISLYFQKRGFDVLGIDASPLAIKVCKLRGLQKARAMSITDVSSPLGMFDTILMIGNNFGLFGSPNRAKRFTQAVRRLNEFKGVDNCRKQRPISNQ